MSSGSGEHSYWWDSHEEIMDGEGHEGHEGLYANVEPAGVAPPDTETQGTVPTGPLPAPSGTGAPAESLATQADGDPPQLSPDELHLILKELKDLRSQRGVGAIVAPGSSVVYNPFAQTAPSQGTAPSALSQGPGLSAVTQGPGLPVTPGPSLPVGPQGQVNTAAHLRLGHLYHTAKSLKPFCGGSPKAKDDPSRACEPVLARVIQSIQQALSHPSHGEEDKLNMLGYLLMDQPRVYFQNFRREGRDWTYITKELSRVFPCFYNTKGLYQALNNHGLDNFSDYYHYYRELLTLANNDLPSFEEDTFQILAAEKGRELMPAEALQFCSWKDRNHMETLLNHYNDWNHNAGPALKNPNYTTQVIANTPKPPSSDILTISSDTICYSCKGMGHLAKVCPSNPKVKDKTPKGGDKGKKQNEGGQGQRGKGHNAKGQHPNKKKPANQEAGGGSGGTRPKTTTSGIICYKCHLPGHKSNECKTRCKRANCGEAGHATKWCPKHTDGPPPLPDRQQKN